MRNMLLRCSVLLVLLPKSALATTGEAGFRAGFFILLAISVVGILLTLYIIRVNREMSRLLAEKEAAEEMLKQSENQLKQLLETAPFPLVIERLSDHRIVYCNNRAAECVEMPRSAVIGNSAAFFFKSPSEYVQLLDKVTTSPGQILDDEEVSLFRADGKEMRGFIAATIIQFEGEESLFASFSDATERLNAEAALEEAHATATEMNRKLQAALLQLEEMASTDRLTRIGNRRALEDRAAGELERANRYGNPLSVIMFDLDHFKRVNDTYGHNAGDTVLKNVAQIVQDNIRKSDFLGRWGGEEFLVLTPEIEGQDAEKLAEKLRQSISDTMMAEAGRITASFGVAQYLPGENLESFIKRADDGLYRAKNSGRNRVMYIRPEDMLRKVPKQALKLEWDESYECGVSHLDEQHQNLFIAANDLIAAVAAGEKAYSHINLLLDETIRHFRDEEQFLESIGYPGLAEHRKQHMELINSTNRFILRGSGAGRPPEADFMAFIINDLIFGHMLRSDKEFFPAVKRWQAEQQATPLPHA